MTGAVPDFMLNGHSHPYGNRALDGECQKIVAAQNGTRNSTLNEAAFAVAQLVAGGEVSHDEAKSRLTGAAADCGLDPAEVKATLESAFAAGVQSPRSAPESRSDFRPNGFSSKKSESFKTSSPKRGSVCKTDTLSDLKPSPYQWTDPASIPVRQALYGNHLFRKFVSVTIAPGGVGKSSLLIAETLAMVSGKPLLGVDVPDSLRVWLWNLEDPRDELQRRIQAACQQYELEPDDLGDRLFVDTGREKELCLAVATNDGAIIQEPVVEALTREIKANQIDLLIVDPFISSHAVSENDNPAIDAVTKAWGKIADETNCAISLVHHTRKQSVSTPE